jgi:serine beta-lactamase-like protein LACTB, mitochondrial
MDRDKLKLFAAISSIIVGLFTFFPSSSAIAQQKAIGPGKEAEIRTTVSAFMAANSIPGVSVAIVENGEFEWSAGFGLADLEHSVPATAQTLFRLASISKTFTATATMLLWQNGKLDLDAPVQKYCPIFPQKPYPITTRQLLAHLGGIRNGATEPIDRPETVVVRHFEDPIQGGLQLFKDDPLIDNPGRSQHYSGYGYVVVGCVIEGASGEKYADYVREHVLLPAGMTDTRVDNHYDIVPHRSRFYSKDKTGSIVNSQPSDSSGVLPADGWLSSADDLAKFEVALLNDRLVKRSTRDLMWTSVHGADNEEKYYALGWGTGENFGISHVGHGGGDYGTSTFITMAPDRRCGVVVLMNLNGGNASDLA